MNTTFRILLVASALLPGWSVIQAAPPTETLARGRVLVLKNDRTIEGEIERIGDQFRIRRDNGETWIPVVEGSRICLDLEEAYKILRTRTNPDDPDEHIRLAQWCNLRGLRTQAIAEVQTAIQIQPENKHSQRLLRLLQQNEITPPTRTEVAPPLQEVNANLPDLDVTSECFHNFLTHIQPILMNACVNCHGGSHAGPFKLARVNMESVYSRKTTQKNLSAVMSQVNLKTPEVSPLLLKAQLPHGGQSVAPLNVKGPQRAALTALQDWTKQTVDTNPLIPQQLGSFALALPQTTEGRSMDNGNAILPARFADSRTNSDKKVEDGPPLVRPVERVPAATGSVERGTPAAFPLDKENIPSVPGSPATQGAEPRKSDIKPTSVTTGSAAHVPTGECDPGPFNKLFHPAKN